MAPAKPPLPGTTNLRFHPAAGIHSSILIAESVLGISVAVTRQKAGRSANGELGPPPRAPRPCAPAAAPRAGAAGGAAPPRPAGNGANFPASTRFASVIVVCGSANDARLSHEAAAAGVTCHATHIKKTAHRVTRRQRIVLLLGARTRPRAGTGGIVREWCYCSSSSSLDLMGIASTSAPPIGRGCWCVEKRSSMMGETERWSPGRARTAPYTPTRRARDRVSLFSPCSPFRGCMSGASRRTKDLTAYMKG